ncbi:hypothetical protein HPB49_022498 [Dermacentor silvarum]|uniref:Uncharacterized protein n=1 Tax=Dermacentor silvarum TaxID=543639 RepID=A0ACB8CN98_DERSI|nr:hypothetical protein HPB49_022498 [Dermacentor silvarum]
MRAAAKLTSATAAEEDLVRVKETNNTMMMSTPCINRSGVYASVKTLKLGVRDLPVSAYVAALENSMRGVIYNAYDRFPLDEIRTGCLKKNEGMEILDARPLGKSKESAAMEVENRGPVKTPPPADEGANAKRVAETSTADTPHPVVKVPSLKADVTILADRVGKLEERHDRLEAWVDRIEARLDKIEERFDAFTNEFRAFQTQVMGMFQQLHTLLEARLPAVVGQVPIAAKPKDKVKGPRGMNGDRFRKTRADTANGEIEDLEAWVEELKQDVKGTTEEVPMEERSALQRTLDCYTCGKRTRVS